MRKLLEILGLDEYESDYEVFPLTEKQKVGFCIFCAGFLLVLSAAGLPEKAPLWHIIIMSAIGLITMAGAVYGTGLNDISTKGGIQHEADD